VFSLKIINVANILFFQGVNPLEWQQVQLSADLPAALKNISLVLTAERKSNDSLVLLKQVDLC